MKKEILEQEYLARLYLLDQSLNKFPRLKYAILHHKNIRGEPMRFDDKPYLMAIYKDEASWIVMQSSVQTGKTEFLMISAFEGAERGLQVMYVIPTEQLRNQFVANRVDAVIEKVPYYKAQLKGGSDSRGLKRFGTGSIFYSGSNSATTFIEKPLDMIVADEIDRFDLVNYEKADDRMTASPFKLKREASNPTVEKFGINASYRQTNQMEFFVKCDGCQKWQTMDWFKNVVRQTDSGLYELRDSTWYANSGRDVSVLCRNPACAKPLNRFTHRSGWVAKHPHIKGKHGYHIHQMLSSYVSIESMWDKFCLALEDDTKMQVFYNSGLGLPFAGAGSKLTDDLLNQCKEEYLMPPSCAEPCVMGVDVGKWLHVVIRSIQPQGEKLRLVFAGTVREFEELDFLMKRFNVVTYVIDAAPETRKSIAYARKHTGKGYIARYHNGIVEIREQREEGYKVVSADRTMLMDRVMAWFLQRRMELPANAQSIDRGDYYEMLKTPTRVFDAERRQFVYLGDPDHYFHAEVYAMLAYAVRGEFRVHSIQVGGGHTPTAPANEEELMSRLPPNADPVLRAHYKRMLEQLGKLDNT
jgi:hypothetical protein